VDPDDAGEDADGEPAAKRYGLPPFLCTTPYCLASFLAPAIHCTVEIVGDAGVKEEWGRRALFTV
jgi:hypothetical protein